ncbi:hypothetical protein KIW84_050247 [Lathyrus oleraceus]|uniref:Hexosyltransferase n=1 Tax=Pisum sativum TaxID=3888 RepID=A0A9D4WKP6_PEA|nr:hypothetical protein KIW84_050247 [Pisum sativum]
MIVFHLVTDEINYAAMKAWFTMNDFRGVTVEVQNDNGKTPIKFRNPKYLSMLNHLGFYVPEVFPALKKNVTGIYHYWQENNVDRTLWELGTLPPGLLTFYGLTEPLDPSWHVLGFWLHKRRFSVNKERDSTALQWELQTLVEDWD